MAAETNNQGNAGGPLEKDFSNGTRYPPKCVVLRLIERVQATTSTARMIQMRR